MAGVTKAENLASTINLKQTVKASEGTLTGAITSIGERCGYAKCTATNI